MSDTQLILTAGEKAALHEYDKAETLYRKYLEKNPNDSAIWKSLGDILITQQKYYDAIDAYAASLDADMTNPEYLVALGSAYAKIHQFEDAKTLFEKAAASTGEIRYQYLVGDMLGYMGKYDEALVLYTLLATTHPDEPGLYKRMATVHRHLNRPSEELTCTTKELALRKKIVDEKPDASAWFKYGDVLARCRIWNEAKDAFSKALSFEENAETHLRLGETLYRMKDTAGALTEFEKAADFDKRDFIFLMHLADSLTKLELFDDSIRYYTKALELRSVHADAWVGIAYDLLNMNRLDDAKAFFEMAKASAAVRELLWTDKLHKSKKTDALDAAFK